MAGLSAGVSFERLLLGLIGLVLVIAVVPAGLAIDRRLRGELVERSRDDLARATRILDDRIAVQVSGLMMHAKELAAGPELVAAVKEGRFDAAAAAAARTADSFGESAVLRIAGESHAGPTLPDSIVDGTRRGEMPTLVVELDGVIYFLSVAPVVVDGSWVGAAGVTRRWGDSEAAILSTLTRSDVVLLTSSREVVGSTLADEPPAVMAAAAAPLGGLLELTASDDTWFAMGAPLGGGSALFLRGMARELAVADALRRIGGGALALALLLSLVVGGLVARWVGSPLKGLAHAAERLSIGDFKAPLPRAPFRELNRVAAAFETMRTSLAARIAELHEANRELADRQERLAALQAEMIRQDRLAASGRLVAQLAHEVRNPVANVRNCLELLRRNVSTEPRAQEYLDIAVEELRRMHDLAERLLDLHRPGDPSQGSCDAVQIASKVATLQRIGGLPHAEIGVATGDDESLPVALPPDVLTQILASLVQNAVEAMPAGGSVEIRLRKANCVAIIDVLDEGPGIAPEVLPRVFDPFFTTKRSVQGVGLCLFVAEAMARSYGGRLSAGNRADRRGATFRLQVGTAVPAVLQPEEVPA